MSTLSTSRDTSYSSINGPVTASVIGHVVAILVMIFGLPFIANDPEILMNPVPVEIISSAELAERTQKPAPEKQEEPKPEEMAPPPQVKQMPQMTEESPPAPEPVQEMVAPDPVPPPPSADIPEPEVETPEAKVKPAPVPEEKPKPPVNVQKKEEPKPKEEPKKDAAAFNSLLKNLAETEEAPPPTPTQEVTDASSPINDAFSTNKLSMSEIDAVRAQISECWNFNTGAQYAEKLIVTVRLVMNPDRTVNSAKVLENSMFGNRDPAYRAAADAALRAVRNPNCSPLKLPPNKYDEWKYISIDFDPSKML